jgi:hypothetical protein
MRTKLTQEEKQYFVKYVRKGMPHLPYKVSDPQNVEMYWNDRYDVDNGILGSYSWYRKNQIDLNPLGKNVPSMLVSTVAHELHHKWQYEEYGIFYCLMLVPILRQLLLEQTADEVEYKMDDLMQDKGFTEE